MRVSGVVCGFGGMFLVDLLVVVLTVVFLLFVLLIVPFDVDLNVVVLLVIKGWVVVGIAEDLDLD